MPWDSNNIPDAFKNLSKKAKKIAIKIANAALKSYQKKGDENAEGEAIATALKQVKSITNMNIENGEFELLGNDQLGYSDELKPIVLYYNTLTELTDMTGKTRKINREDFNKAVSNSVNQRSPLHLMTPRLHHGKWFSDELFKEYDNIGFVDRMLYQDENLSVILGTVKSQYLNEIQISNDIEINNGISLEGGNDKDKNFIIYAYAILPRSMALDPDNIVEFAASNNSDEYYFNLITRSNDMTITKEQFLQLLKEADEKFIKDNDILNGIYNFAGLQDKNSIKNELSKDKEFILSILNDNEEIRTHCLSQLELPQNELSKDDKKIITDEFLNSLDAKQLKESKNYNDIKKTLLPEYSFDDIKENDSFKSFVEIIKEQAKVIASETVASIQNLLNTKNLDKEKLENEEKEYKKWAKF